MDGSIGDGGQHYNLSVVGGRGRLRNTNWAVGVAEEMTDVPTIKKNAQPPPPQLINNDWHLNCIFQSASQALRMS